MTTRNRTLAMTIGAIVILAGTIVEKPSPIYILNSSESVPLGLYRLRTASNYYVTELVAVQPPEPLATYLDRNGYLPAGVPMLKRVLALPGQTICRNGTTLRRWHRDGRGAGARQPWPDVAGLGRVRDRRRRRALSHELASRGLFDGRYFGMTPATAVIGRVLPVWTWED